MTDNTIDMSKADNLSVRDGKVIGCEIRASSVGNWSVDGATVRAVSVQGSKMSDFHCASASVLRGLRVQGASVKDFRILEGSKLADILINCTAISDAKLIRSSLSAGEIQASKISDFLMQGCEARDLMVRRMSLRKVHLAGCAFQDVVFSGSDGWAWKKQGLKDVRLENCRLEKVPFTDCRIADAVIRNVTLKDRQFRNLDLRGKTLDGNEAFLQAAGAA